MSDDMDQQLKRALGEHTEGVRVVADLAERAIARDRSNRRRELGVAGLAAGLVLAVAVPMGWGALRPTGVRPLPVGPSQSTTAPTDSPSPSSSRATTAPTPTAIPTVTADGAPAPVTARFAAGEPTATTDIPYVVRGVIHQGTEQTAVDRAISGGTLATLAGGRWLVGQGDLGVHRVVQPLDLPTVRLPAGQATVSGDGNLIVVETQGTLRAYDGSGTFVRTLPASACGCAVAGSEGSSPGFEVVGIIGSVVYANRGYRMDGVAWDAASGDRRAVSRRLALVDGATGTALTAQDPNLQSARTCHELVDLETDRIRWRLCGPLLFRSFSSDGRYLLATGQFEGPDGTELNPDRSFKYGGLVVVRTSDAAVVLEGGGSASGASGSAVTYRMGADDTITVQVGSANGTRNLQRCTLNGVCEVVAPALPRDRGDIPEGEDPYFLSTN
ncbi:hypothetical protein GCM10009868_01780 [Terrabacter aerolatus]|uniref:Uncharacterized protein n=1 Tax=Terrabacter aerolatus TaxID=422442 RepID=A0A512D2J9_9MICO|nr:hypothetical protein [Terrabacter aerolatus]GEO30705.1 hypothetical protein TAE01_25150 [Terrabacter aerolatus]